MKQPDLADFIQAMIIEINDHTETQHWPLWIDLPLKAQKQIVQFGLSKESGDLMVLSLSIRLDFVLIAVCKYMAKPIGILMLQ